MGGTGGAPTVFPTVRADVGNPAAGADWSYVIPAGNWQMVVAAHNTFVTSATVANRGPSFNITDGAGNELWAQGITAVVPASSFIELLFQVALSFTSTAPAAGINAITLPPLWLPPGFTIRSNTSALQAGDQWSNIHLWLAQQPGAPAAGGLPLFGV